MKVACAFALCLVAYCSPASAGSLWKCPGNPPTFELDLEAVGALSRGCERLTQGDGPTVPAPAAVLQPKSNWIGLGKDQGQCEFYWDPSTYATKGKHRKAWFMESCKDATKLDGPYTTNKSKLFLLYFDCSEQTYASLQWINYSDEYATGSAVGSATYTLAQAKFTEAAPNTTGAMWLRVVCGRPASR